MSGNHHDAVMRWLHEQGATGVRSVHRGGGHPKIVFRWRDEDWRIVVSGTAGNAWTAARDAITDLRHLMGLVGGEKTVGERRPKKSKTPREKRARLKHMTQKSDYSKFAPHGGVAKLADCWP